MKIKNLVCFSAPPPNFLLGLNFAFRKRRMKNSSVWLVAAAAPFNQVELKSKTRNVRNWKVDSSSSHLQLLKKVLQNFKVLLT